MVVKINKLDTCQFSFARQFNIALKLLQTVFNGSGGRVFLIEFVQTGKGSHMFNRSCDLRDVLMASVIYLMSYLIM